MPGSDGPRYRPSSCCGAPAAGVLLDPVGAPAHGATGLRSLVSLVRRAGIDDQVWNHSTFSKNRDRLLAGAIATEFLAQVLDQPQVRRLLSSEHFSVDGSLVEAWASMKNFRPKDKPDDPPSGGRNGTRDCHGERRTNDSHGATTDPDARLYRKGPGQEAKLCFVGHVLMENRHGLVVDAELTRASGHAERLAALAMLDRLPTVGPRRLLPTAASTPGTLSWRCGSAG